MHGLVTGAPGNVGRNLVRSPDDRRRAFRATSPRIPKIGTSLRVDFGRRLTYVERTRGCAPVEAVAGCDALASSNPGAKATVPKADGRRIRAPVDLAQGGAAGGTLLMGWRLPHAGRDG